MDGKINSLISPWPCFWGCGKSISDNCSEKKEVIHILVNLFNRFCPRISELVLGFFWDLLFIFSTIELWWRANFCYKKTPADKKDETFLTEMRVLYIFPLLVWSVFVKFVNGSSCNIFSERVHSHLHMHTKCVIGSLALLTSKYFRDSAVFKGDGDTCRGTTFVTCSCCFCQLRSTIKGKKFALRSKFVPLKVILLSKQLVYRGANKESLKLSSFETENSTKCINSP